MDDKQDIKRKLYNAEKSKRSYLKNKEEIARRRALARLEKGSMISSYTIKESVITQEDKSLLEQLQSRQNEHMFIPDRSPQFIENHQDKVTMESQGFYQLLPEDNESISYISTLEKTHNIYFTLQHGFDMIDEMIDNDYLMKDKSEIQKQIAKRNYKSKLHTLMSIYGSTNLYDIYVNPERFLNKMMTSHISLGSVKGYISIVITFYNYSENMKHIIHNGQINKIKKHLKIGIEFSKEEELQRLENEPYYKWDDFKRIVKLIMDHPLANTIQGLRDQVIINMYVKESVLRDNLGMIQLVTRNPKSKVNFLNLQTGFLKLNDFKTSKSFKHAEFYISFDTLYLIREYIYNIESILQKKVDYLITKNDGTPYKDGKLSSYISDMFQRYTGAKNVSINDLRHSLATHHRESPQRIKDMISDRLHHSYRQHILYERHSNHHLQFPVLKDSYVNEDLFLDESVAVIQTDKKKTIILFGKIIRKINDNTYLIQFNNRRYKPAEFTFPHDRVVIM